MLLTDGVKFSLIKPPGGIKPCISKPLPGANLYYLKYFTPDSMIL